jgi:hypothetical protein
MQEGLPAELIKAKQEELEGLQGKKAKCFEHKRAEKFDLKYKHIRFFGTSCSGLAPLSLDVVRQYHMVYTCYYARPYY